MLVGSDLSVRRGAITALHGVSLELRPGQVFGVLGPNGAGKSTLLATLCGELEPVTGQVLLNGRRLNEWPDRDRACRLAVLPQ
ncbi:MAG TPA: heme ABC transporter ATP-binding protein, partial [Pseudomonas sp.]|nr:heme ABC transporter ATP-binding protein [Pseudomonas sp.]